MTEKYVSLEQFEKLSLSVMKLTDVVSSLLDALHQLTSLAQKKNLNDDNK